jgi:hypothetical protein
MVNLSLKQGSFPECFKQAIISPLLKNHSLYKNYRPVSGLPFFPKLSKKWLLSKLKSS